MKNSMNPFFGS